MPDAAQSANPQRTLGAVRREIAARLRAAFRQAGRGGTPDLDARLLVAAAARIDPAVVPLRDDNPVDSDLTRRAFGFADRRIRGEPVARIAGRKEFRGLDLLLSPATLVPRPDTETLVEAALAHASAGADGSGVRILDLGTGSGAILLALLAALPTATGVGTDISVAALAVARENARRLGLLSRAGFVAGNWTAPVGDAAFDLVVANPPYIASAEIAALEVEVRDHDPKRALDGGRDGLAAFRAILGDLGRVLAAGGTGFIEIGAGQRAPVAAIAQGSGLDTRFVADLAGLDRVAVVAPGRDPPL
jgi:release factor glutamine methyltransferase